MNMTIGLLIIMAFLIGTGVGAIIPPMVTYLRRRDASLLVLVNPDNMRMAVEWRPLRGRYPGTKIAGQKARLPLTVGYRHDAGDGRSGFLLNTKTGLPMRVETDPAKLRRIADDSESGVCWPNSYDLAEAYSDTREEKVANSSRDKGADYAKWGAVAGGVAVMLLFVVIGLAIQLLRRAGEFT